MKNIKTLYFECYSGISGDMVVASLIDLGVSTKHLRKILEKLPMAGYKIEFVKEKKKSLTGTIFRVIEEEECQGTHCERNIDEVNQLILCSELSKGVKETAMGIIRIVAQEEAKTQGIGIQEVCFKELEGTDSLIDIIATAICIEELGIDQVVVSSLYEGQGHIKGKNGLIPVPVPVVLSIINDYNLSIKITFNEGQMITPVGAAIVAYLHSEDKRALDGKVKKVGIGIGTKEFEHPNVLRTMIIERPDEAENSLWRLDDNLENATREVISYCIETLGKEK